MTLGIRVGFEGLFHLGHPFPLTIELGNSGKPLDGLLEVAVSKGGVTKGVEPYLYLHQKEISLSAHSKKIVRFTIDPDSLSRPVRVTFSSPPMRLTREIDLRSFFSPGPLILLITENRILPTIPLVSDSSRPLVTASISELPEDSRAYQGVSTIIFYEQSLRDFSKSKIEALDRWLLSGGRLLILGSIHYALYQEESLRRFLPVRITGLKQLSSLSGLENRYGFTGSGLKNLWVQDSKKLHGTVLIQEKDVPILVESRRGRGQIFYLAADIGRPPLSSWQGLPLLLKNVVRPYVESEVSTQTSWDESIFSRLLLEPSFLVTYVPLRSLFVWMVFYLGGLGVLGWLWLRQRFSRRQGLFALGLLISFSSFGGYFHFERGGYMADGILLSSTFLDVRSDDYVDTESNIALFSTGVRRYNLHVENGWSDIRPVPRLARPQDSVLEIREEGKSTRFDFGLSDWDYKLFRIRSVTYFPFHADIQKEEDRVAVKLVNHTHKDITDCWLVVSGQRFFLGDIPRGLTHAREIRLASGPESTTSSGHNRMALRDIPFGDKTQEFLFRSSFLSQEQTMGAWNGGSALIFGWVRDAPRRVWVDQARVSAYDYMLIRAVVPLGDEDDL